MSEGMADTLLIAVRFVHFATAMLLFGASLFPAYAGARPVASRGTRPALAGLMLASALAWLDIESVAISGEPGAWASAAMVGKVLGHTEFGHIWQWRLGILTALAVVAFAKPGRRIPDIAVTLLSGLAVLTLAGIGHGAMGIGRGIWLHLANQAIHMMAASIWVGGLMALAAAGAALARRRDRGTGASAILRGRDRGGDPDRGYRPRQHVVPGRIVRGAGGQRLWPGADGQDRRGGGDGGAGAW